MPSSPSSRGRLEVLRAGLLLLGLPAAFFAFLGGAFLYAVGMAWLHTRYLSFFITVGAYLLPVLLLLGGALVLAHAGVRLALRRPPSPHRHPVLEAGEEKAARFWREILAQWKGMGLPVPARPPLLRLTFGLGLEIRWSRPFAFALPSRMKAAQNPPCFALHLGLSLPRCLDREAFLLLLARECPLFAPREAFPLFLFHRLCAAMVPSYAPAHPLEEPGKPAGEEEKTTGGPLLFRYRRGIGALEGALRASIGRALFFLDLDRARAADAALRAFGRGPGLKRAMLLSQVVRGAFDLASLKLQQGVVEKEGVDDFPQLVFENTRLFIPSIRGRMVHAWREKARQDFPKAPDGELAMALRVEALEGGAPAPEPAGIPGQSLPAASFFPDFSSLTRRLTLSLYLDSRNVAVPGFQVVPSFHLLGRHSREQVHQIALESYFLGLPGPWFWPAWEPLILSGREGGFAKNAFGTPGPPGERAGAPPLSAPAGERALKALRESRESLARLHGEFRSNNENFRELALRQKEISQAQALWKAGFLPEAEDYGLKACDGKTLREERRRIGEALEQVLPVQLQWSGLLARRTALAFSLSPPSPREGEALGVWRLLSNLRDTFRLLQEKVWEMEILSDNVMGNEDMASLAREMDRGLAAIRAGLFCIRKLTNGPDAVFPETTSGLPLGDYLTDGFDLGGDWHDTLGAGQECLARFHQLEGRVLGRIGQGAMDKEREAGLGPLLLYTL